jgi:hypothetical protein
MSQRYLGGLINSNANTNNSVLFNGSSTYLSLAGGSQYAIASSTTPFTIEFWIRPTAAGGVVFTEQYTGTGNSIPIVCALATTTAVETNAGLYPAFGWYNGSAWTTAAVSTTQLVLNVWSHVAFVFTGSTSKVYINGVDVTKASAPTPATTWGVTGVSGDGWFISKRWDASAGGSYITGNISNLRFVNGTAVYTANFTVPYILLPITNTALLTCQSTSFIDNSSYSAVVTNVNSSTIVPESPFTLTPPYNPALGAATPGVWTLSQANQAAGQRSWNMYDPFFNLNTAMVHGNGTNGGANNTFLDSSTNNFTVTRNGNTTQGTFTPFSKTTGYWSNYFDGTGDYLSLGGQSQLAFGTNDFTIECLFYLSALPVSPRGAFIYDSRPAADGSYPTLFVVHTTNVLNFYVNTAVLITGTTTIRVGKWYHVVVSRVSGNTRMFLDGVQEGPTTANASSYLNGASRPLIGNNGLNLDGGLNGYISNVRVLNGTGTTAPTVPTAPLTAITNTQLLTCQDGRFIDNSANNFTVTKTGDVRTITFSPFYSPTAYTPQANGGAMYFDGTGDYLTVADNASLELGSSDFCIEMLIYTTAVATDAILITKRASSAAYAPILIYRNSAAIRVGMSSNGSSWNMVDPTTTTLGNVTTNQWFHISVYRVGTAIYGSLNGTITTLNASTSATALNNTDPYYIGSDSNLSPYVGYISNLRMVIGSSVYTSGSAPYPTAPLTPITNTQLLLSGTNGSFIDNATNLAIETVNTSISTAQSKFGGSSMSFNGSSTYASLITPFGFGSNAVQTLGDFTVEGWVYVNSLSANQTIFQINGNATGYAAVRFDINATSGNLTLLVSTSGAAFAINTTNSTSPLTTSAWTHLAIVRTGGAFIVYFNGTAIITSTAVASTTAVIAGTITTLGAHINGGTFFQYLNGYISDFRLTNSARYQGGFTPPTSTLQNQ